jgi:2-polyprenyl-3-methyl-5-hydroxy-6-metoxy-1,4-benzoquinol methylase
MDNNQAHDDTGSRHTGKVIDRANGYDVIECEGCGFRHVVPIPDPAQLKKIYEEEYYSTEKPDYFKNYEEDGDWWNLSYDDRFDFEANLSADRRRILDIGSGPGIFLRRGKSALAGSGNRTFARRSIRVRSAWKYAMSLTADTQGLGQFDVIHMSAVLEHIPDPISMLEIAHRLLLPEGVLCVVVPNDYNPFQIALRSACDYKPWWLAPPHHINYFEPSSLKRTMQRAGFTVTALSTTFPIDMFLLMGDNYTVDGKLGRHATGRGV